MATVRTNLKNNAPTQYSNFDFTSMCLFNGVPIGAGPNGLFRLCCGDDDNGTDIDAYFIPVVTDFGVLERKTMRYAYLSGHCDGSVTVRAEGNGAGVSGPHECAFLGTEERQQQRVQLGRGLKASFFEVKIANASGSRFKIDSVFVHLDINAKAHK